MKKNNTTLQVSHCTDFKNSGINEEEISKLGENGLESVSREIATKYLNGIKVLSGGWMLKYPQLESNILTSYAVFKADNPFTDEKGKPVKYLRPKKQETKIYRPPFLAPETLTNACLPLFITEGEKKAIKATLEGYNCISIGGVWNWKTKNNDDNLISDLKRINWENREVFLVPDNDFREKPQVINAFVRLGLRLNKLGAKAKLIKIPQSIEKQGFDDFLKKYGKAEFEKHKIQAVEINEKTAFQELNPIEKIGFPLEIFPEHLRKLIEKASWVMDSPKEFIATSILAGAGAIINSKAKVILKNNWIEPCILWLMVVATPSKQSKSPCFRLIKKSIDRLDEKLKEQYDIEKKQYKDDFAIYKKELENWKKERSSEQPPQEPQKPFRNIIYTSETTVEGLKKIQSKTDKGIAIINDEISSMLRSLNQYKNSGNDEQYMQSAFNAERMTYTRAGDDEPTSLIPFHNIFGTTQPVEVEKLVFKDIISTNGTAERWLYCLSDHVKSGKLIDETIDTKILNEVYEKLFDMQEGTYYKLSPEAKEIFFKCYENYNLEAQKANISNLMSSYMIKQLSYIGRFALILHCLNNPDSGEIEPQTMINAIKISKYFIDCFEKIANISADIKNNSLEEYTIEWMKTKNIKEISPSKLYLANKSRFKTSNDAKETLQKIAQMGLGDVLEQKNGIKLMLY